MAHTLSAKKRIRQNDKRQALNRWRKNQIKNVVKTFEASVKSGDQAKMSEALQACYKTLDQVASKGTIHKNTASRTKARLAKALNRANA